MIANEVRIFTASEGAWQLELELLQPSLAVARRSAVAHGPCTDPPHR